MGVYLPYGFEPLTAQQVAQRYEEIIDGLDQRKYNDYVDPLDFMPEIPDEFSIRYIPMDKNLRFYINGVIYRENIHYSLNREEKRITWLFTKRRGGFDLEPHFNYLAIYDIS